MKTRTYGTTRIWERTLQTLRFIHAMTGESIVAILDGWLNRNLTAYRKRVVTKLKSFKYRLSPTGKQAAPCSGHLTAHGNCTTPRYRNGVMRTGWRPSLINYYSQANQLPGIKDIREEYKDIHSQVLQDVLRRVDKAMQAFFRRVKSGETPGYPRFKAEIDTIVSPIHRAGFSLPTRTVSVFPRLEASK